MCKDEKILDDELYDEFEKNPTKGRILIAYFDNKPEEFVDNNMEVKLDKLEKISKSKDIKVTHQEKKKNIPDENALF